MSTYPFEQQESEYLHTALLEYQRDTEQLTVDLTAARARIAELEAEVGLCAIEKNFLKTENGLASARIKELEAAQNQTPLDRPDKPGWWWFYDDSLDRYECYQILEDLRAAASGAIWVGKWLPATPPPVPMKEKQP